VAEERFVAVRSTIARSIDDALKRQPVGHIVWGAESRFSRCEAVFVDQSTEAISALDPVCSR
jgi:hypothetical protein